MVDAAGLQRSFGRVAAYGDEVPLYFYSHLFLTHPETRVMFPVSMAAQRDRLVGALLRVVSNVHQVQTVVPFLQQLGRDHRKYGVLPEHYPFVGASLLAALEHFLEDDWTPELAADWAAAYQLVAEVMSGAAEEAGRTAPAWYDAEVVGHEIRTPGIAVVTVRPEHPIAYTPGESVSVQTPVATRMWRYFSPANAPRADHTVEFHVRAVDGGWVSPALVNSTGKGDVVRLGAPVGSFRLAGGDREVLMIAGGTGLAPLRAMIEQLALDGTERPVSLYLGARSEAELYDLDALRARQRENRWLSLVPVVEKGGGAGVSTGDVAAVAVAHRVWREHDVHLCGSPEMVARSIETLAGAGIDPAAVRCESYAYSVPDEGVESIVLPAHRESEVSA